jgi:hypothetical protein
MRKILISAAVTAAAATLVAAPASAQYRGQDRGGWDQRDHRDDRGYGNNNANRQAVNQLMRDLDRAESQIQRGVQRGNISQREAQGLRREAANIRQRLQRASRNGLSRGEVNELRMRIDRLEQRVRYERRDRDGRRW